MKKLMAGVMATACAAVFAWSAAADPNPNSAAGTCGPPGQTISQLTPNPGNAFGEPPGQAVKADCAPGQ